MHHGMIGLHKAIKILYYQSKSKKKLTLLSFYLQNNNILTSIII